jgi:hypothetical protein
MPWSVLPSEEKVSANTPNQRIEMNGKKRATMLSVNRSVLLPVNDPRLHG